jgi:hypothetical protein
VVKVNMENSSHCHEIESYTLNALELCFPVPQKVKIKPFLTDYTYNQVLLGHSLGKQVKKLEARFDKTLLFAVMGIWSGQLFRAKFDCVYGFNSADNFRKYIIAKTNAKSHQKLVCSLIKMDKLAQIDLEHDNMVKSYEDNDIVSMHKSVKAVMRFAGKSYVPKSTRVINDEGHVSQSYIEERNCFKKYFCKLMQGSPSKFSEVIDTERKCDKDRYKDISEKSWMAIPSPTDVQCMKLLANANKACGENRIVGAVDKVFPHTMLNISYPLIVKTYVRLQPSIQYKGGMIHEIFKGKGHHFMCASYRDVLLANDSGKQLSKSIRRKLIPRAKQLVFSSQYGGGFNGGETSFTHLYVRIILDTCRAMNISSAILFLDVVTAFAMMLRRTVFDLDEGDEAWFHKLSSSGFSKEDILAIKETVCAIAPWEIDSNGNLIVCSDEHLVSINVRLSKYWYTNTWMTVEGTDGVFTTNVGCLAGTPLADLLFTVSVARILYVYRKSINADKLTSTININGVDHILDDASFVDDCAIPVVDSAINIANKVCSIAEVAYKTFKCFNLDLNFSRGKSECVLSLCGKGKKKAMQSLFKAGNKVSFVGIKGEQICLLFVKSYKHVGTKIPFDSTYGEEVSTRCAIMRSGTAKFQKQILKNRSICVNKRLFMLQVYILTKGTFQSCTWHHLPLNTFKKFNGCILDMYRKASGHYHGNKLGYDVINDVDLLYKYEMMCPETIIRIARLGLFCRLLVKAPPPLLALVLESSALSGSWGEEVQRDLKWLELDPAFTSCKMFSFAQWQSAIIENPKAFKKRVNKYARTRIANVPNHESVTKNDGTKSGTDLSCVYCEYQCMTLQQLNLHMFKKHQVKNMWRHYVGDLTYCRICMKQFHTRERLLNHVRYKSKVCRVNMLLHGPICDEINSTEHDQQCTEANVLLQQQSRRRAHAVDPVVQLTGPSMILGVDEHQSGQRRLGNGHNYFGGATGSPN